MSKHQMTPTEREARIERRRTAREAAAAKVDEFRQWRLKRAEAAQIRIAQRDADLRKSRRRKTGFPVGGVPTVERYDPKPRPDGTLPQVDSTLGTSIIGGRRITASYAERRARGARGRPRKPRRRELPGAEARRIERNRKAALSTWAR